MKKWQPITTLPRANGGYGSLCVGIARAGEYARLAYLNHPVFTFLNPCEGEPTHWISLQDVTLDMWPDLVSVMEQTDDR